MTNKEFIAFVKRPRHIENTDGIILYEDKNEDESYKSNYWTNCKIILPVILAYILIAFYFTNSITIFARKFLVNGAIGLLLVWTLIEYVQHRFFLHKEFELDPNSEANPETIEQIFRWHLLSIYD